MILVFTIMRKEVHNMNETQIKLREIVELQKEYSKMASGKIPFTKRNLCDLCIPFRDKYGLNDDQVLRLARKQMDIAEIIDVMCL